MKAISRYAGLAGLLLILAAGAGYALAPQIMAAWLAPLGLALVCLIGYVVFHLSEIRAFFFSRTARYGAGSLLATLLVAGIIVVVSVMSVRHSYRWDLTKNKRFTLSQQTVKLLSNMAEPVKVYGFFQEAGPDKAMARELFDQYARVSDKFGYEMIDPDREPARTKAAKVTRYGTVVVESAGRQEQILTATEQDLTNAILRLNRPDEKRIYFLSGHGEKDPDEFDRDGYSTVKNALEEKRYEVKKLILMQVEDVPLDAIVLVVAGPQKDPFPNELEAIDRYLKRGGRVIFMVDPQTCPELSNFLERYKVLLGQDVVVDKLSRIFGADYRMPVVSRYTAHPITRDFDMASFFPLARSVRVSEQEIENVTAVPLAQTSENAWGETDLAELARGSAGFDEVEDLAGPVPVAVVGSIRTMVKVDKKDKSAEQDEQTGQDNTPDEVPGPEGKFVVFGDSDFVSNSYVNFQGNGNLFYSTLSWLAEEGDLIAIQPKVGLADPLLLTPIKQRLIFWIPVVLLPLVVLLFGVFILGRRRGR